MKRETIELGTEICPGKGVLIEEVSKHQETLSLAGLGEVFNFSEGKLTGRKNK